MKKLSFVLLLLCTCAFPLRAQMQYAITGGINYGYFEKVQLPISDATSSLGYMIGVRGSIGENIFFEPAIEFASYGSVLTVLNDGVFTGDNIPSVNHTMRANYIRVPLQVGLKVFDDAPVNIELRAGVTESALVGFTDQITSGSGVAYVRNDLNAFRTAGIVGGGIRVLFLKVDLEYEWGLTNYFANNGASKLNALYLIIGGNF